MGLSAAPPVFASNTLVITALNVSGAAPPSIGTLTVRVRFSQAGLRNVPPVCRPSDVTSPVLVGGFGPSRIIITNLLAAAGPCNKSQAINSDDTFHRPLLHSCDSVYGPEDGLVVTFNQNVTLCLGRCG
jgi:hypothetical protein